MTRKKMKHSKLSRAAAVSSQRNTLKFKNYGVAYAHLTLPVGQYETEARAIERVVPKVSPRPRRWRISFLTGQSDVMLELQVKDFRSAVHLQYTSQAMGANWLFLVPYAGAPQQGARKSGLNYVIHIRFARDAYHGRGVAFEREVVADIQRYAVGYGLPCEVMAGFGWSDLVVSGSFTEVGTLRKFVIDIENYERRRAVHRILTLVGYDRRLNVNNAPVELVTPILFVRARPTHLHQAVAALNKKLPSRESWITHSTDGKWDLVFHARKGVPLRSYLRMHRKYVVDGNELSSAGIERFESHLLASRVRSDASRKVNVVECACKSQFDAQPPVHVAVGTSANELPRALTRAIMNVTDLFRAASRDTTNCCDVVPSLLRCAAAGRRLVNRHRRLLARVEQVGASTANSEELIRWLAVLARARDDIEDWCTYSERSVSQRTVGRFEEFLAQNERVVSYRGGIQKMLYIADVLTDAYAKRILPAAEDRTFVTLYDPVDTVLNMRTSGFIRVPVRYLFFLPLSVTHLWHEVGVHAFFCNYEVPFDERARRRAIDFARRSPAESMQDVVRLHVEVSEMYGDLITFHYGFRENIEAFVIALTSAMLEGVAFRSAPTTGKESFLVYLLMRLYLVVEFKTRRDMIEAELRENQSTCNRDAIDAWRPGAKVVERAASELAGLINRELLTHARYVEEPAMHIALRELAESNFDLLVKACGDLDVAHRQFMKELAWKLPPVAKEQRDDIDAYEAIVRGEVVTFGPNVDPNAVYQRLQLTMIEQIRDMDPDSPIRKTLSPIGKTFLRSTAALMRSVLLSFYAQDGRRERKHDGIQIRNLLRKKGRAVSTELADLDFRLPGPTSR